MVGNCAKTDIELAMDFHRAMHEHHLKLSRQESQTAARKSANRFKARQHMRTIQLLAELRTRRKSPTQIAVSV